MNAAGEPRDVFLSPLWRLHVGYHLRELAPFPPPGYRFLLPTEGPALPVGLVSRLPIALSLLHAAARVAPVNLLKAALDERSGSQPPAALAYCCHHVSFGSRPWVIEMDAVWDPIGPDPRQFRRFWPKVESLLASADCKRVLVFSEFSRQTLLSLTQRPELRKKVLVLPRAVRAKEVPRRREQDGAFHFLFVGSANVAGVFEMRGGKEVLAAFRRLWRQYPDARLTIRSLVPARLRREYAVVLRLPDGREAPLEPAGAGHSHARRGVDLAVVLEVLDYQVHVPANTYAHVRIEATRVAAGCVEALLSR